MSQPAAFQPRVALRERSGMQIMDLATTVLRAWWRPLLVPLIMGFLPFFLLNLLIGNLMQEIILNENNTEEFFFVHYVLSMILIMETPWISAPVEIAMGGLVFNQRVTTRQIMGRIIRGLPKMILYQVIIRGLLTIIGITILAIPLVLGFVNEIVFLERVSWRRLYKRVKSLNANADQFAFSFAGACFLVVFVASGWYALSVFLSVMEKSSIWLDSEFLIFSDWKLHLLAIAGIEFFAIARFLYYIDVRIRSEGWDLENQVRMIVAERQVRSGSKEQAPA
jgi:hypothetical protein